jgi:acylpyruvate hydrolase
MKVATLRTDTGLRTVRVEADGYVDLGPGDLGSLLTDPGWLERASRDDGERIPTDPARLAPVIPRPAKMICVGLNYRTHITEMGRDLPEFPTLFAKFSEALIGPHDPLTLPPESAAVDWEAELAVVIGRSVRRADAQEASAAIAGYTVLNDVTARDWQHRTKEWLQGKTFEHTTPLGPCLATPDEVADDASIWCAIDGEVVQQAQISDLVFGPEDLVRYISTILTLRPGDVIATGTAGGVGHARKPPRYLRAGQTMVTGIAGIGECVTPVRAAPDRTVP